MMLDTKRTFDALVASLAESEERKKAVLGNVLYQYISTSLAGTQEYMAMEKLYEVKDDPRFDIVLLDTPPTSHALDFLDAPERLVGAIDSPAVRWFLKAFQRSGPLSLNLLQKSAATVLKGMGRITGGGFLEQVATFLSEMNDLFGGWRDRAERISSALRADGDGYVLVTTPEPMSVREVLFFSERLREQSMRPDAYVVNRLHGVQAEVDEAQVEGAVERRKLALDEGAAARILAAVQAERRLGELNRLHLIALEEAFGESEQPARVPVPAVARATHDVQGLAWVSDVLAPG